MSSLVSERSSTTGSTTPQRRTNTGRRGWVLLGGVLALLVLTAAGLAIGSKPIPIPDVVSALLYGEGDAVAIVRDTRLPRTLLGLTVGAALGLAGALMQALTRNPLADPGLMGVNSGAAFGLALAFAAFGVTQLSVSVWFAFAGAGLAAVIVYGIGTRGQGGATPVRLALTGMAVNAALGSAVMGTVLLDPGVFNRFRHWTIGSLAAGNAETLWQIVGFVAIGIVLALALARPLNAIALGEETGRALGANIGLTRIGAAVAVTLLCGAATAGVGPIMFIGLAVPHIVRVLVGPDQRWVLPYSMLTAPILLLTADILGRVVMHPAELSVGVVSAFLGAPVLVALVRGGRRGAKGLGSL